MLTIEQIAYHRNGVCGVGFHVVLFRCDENGRMMATVFPDVGHVAVFQRDMLGNNEIRFRHNSWRGDVYESDLRRAIAAWETEQNALMLHKTPCPSDHKA